MCRGGEEREGERVPGRLRAHEIVTCADIRSWTVNRLSHTYLVTDHFLVASESFILPFF